MRRLIPNGLASLAILAAAIFSQSSFAAHPKPPVLAPLLTPDDSTAVVSFIRRSVLMGDGWNYDVWDGENYVGVLAAGSLLQYKTTPGEHNFLLMGRGAHLWSFMKANLVAGKQYFARAYPLPFSLQPADSNADERVDQWLTMARAESLTDKQKGKVVAKNLKEAQSALEALRTGKIAPDCSAWYPPNHKGEEHPQMTRGGGRTCRSIGDMKPEFGR